MTVPTTLEKNTFLDNCFCSSQPLDYRKTECGFERNNGDKGILELALAACSGFAKPPIAISSILDDIA